MVVPADFVTAEDGTGLVHLAAFGADDFVVAPRAQPRLHGAGGRRAGSSAARPGRRSKGVFVKDADAAIIQRLKDEGHLLHRETVEHTYPFCWRCDTPLLYYPRESWFVRTTAIKDRLLELNRGIALAPAGDRHRAVRRVAREQRGLGAVARPLLGHAAAGVGVRPRRAATWR